MESKIIFILAACLGLAVPGGFAQDMTHVSGMVTTFQSLPLNRVTVSASKSGEEAITDIDGKFVVLVCNKDILRFTAAGFKDKKIRLRSDNILIADLTFVEKRKNIDAAVRNNHISEEALLRAISATSVPASRDYTKYKSIYDLIASEFYNLRVRGNEIVNTKIRSFDRNPRVLLVVDDRIVGDIAFVDPEYIQSIEFIDDVRATLYGVQGANGIIKITLK
ncbi:MAG: hypothetical protein K0B05_01660 [Bacteroidales bacterium]|nr:hypothetical protein [Bacteroidales bacterium]